MLILICYKSSTLIKGRHNCNLYVLLISSNVVELYILKPSNMSSWCDPPTEKSLKKSTPRSIFGIVCVKLTSLTKTSAMCVQYELVILNVMILAIFSQIS